MFDREGIKLSHHRSRERLTNEQKYYIAYPTLTLLQQFSEEKKQSMIKLSLSLSSFVCLSAYSSACDSPLFIHSPVQEKMSKWSWKDHVSSWDVCNASWGT